MSHRKAKKTPQAFADLRQAARYLTIQQNERLANRFVASAEMTFLKLAAMPSLGAFLDTKLLKAPSAPGLSKVLNAMSFCIERLLVVSKCCVSFMAHGTGKN